jgi:hypothetical protein
VTAQGETETSVCMVKQVPMQERELGFGGLLAAAQEGP